jgi:hypothetical protein
MMTVIIITVISLASNNALQGEDSERNEAFPTFITLALPLKPHSSKATQLWYFCIAFNYEQLN